MLVCWGQRPASDQAIFAEIYATYVLRFFCVCGAAFVAISRSFVALVLCCLCLYFFEADCLFF